ncbi:MAG: ribonucleoside triphosphate reductase [Patescibacteria group bacterium]
MPIYKVQKRNGSIVDFDAARIEKAISKAAESVKGTDSAVAPVLTKDVVIHLEEVFPDSIPTVEQIQDVVEDVLIQYGYSDLAKAYILYRQKRTEARADKEVTIEVEKTITEYLEKLDWRVNANSNQGYSLGGMILNTAGKVTANYWLSHVYPKAIGDAHRNADIHIHDLDMLSGYCAGWSLRALLEEGFNGVQNKVESNAPKHMSSAVAQMVNFLGTLQNEWAGAQAFSSFDTYMAPFVKKYEIEVRNQLEKSGMTFFSEEKKEKYIEDDVYNYVYQNMQSFVFNLNIPSRWGTQCVDQETECLTEEGWKRYDKIKDEDKILTFNLKEKKYEYLAPLKVTAYDFDGEMYVLKNRTQEQWITPKHKIVRKKFNTEDDYELLQIEDALAFKSPLIALNSWETSSVNEMDPDVIQLLAWVAAEGNFDFSGGRRRVSIFQSRKNPVYIEEIRGILERLGYSYHEQERRSGFSKTATLRLRLNDRGSKFVCGIITEKVAPTVIKTLSKDGIRLFLGAYIKGDGSEEASGRVRIYTKSKKNLDALQELCVLAGYGSTVYKRKDTGVFVLNIIRNKETYIERIEKKSYKGIVWCPTTRNGTFVARRQGKTFITGNTPFTNITLDWTVPDDLKDKRILIGGREFAYTFGELQPEMDIINRAFIEVMTHGDAKGRTFTFPIPTYNITKDFDWEDPKAIPLFEMTAKYGTPYFQNFINSDLNPGDVRSMCCRLQLDLTELRKRGGGLFGSAEMTGSIGVVTINMARIGYLCNGDTRQFYGQLHYLMQVAKTSLEFKRKEIQKWLDRGLFPFTKRYLGYLNNHFSTIGINGLNEAIRNFTNDKENIASAWGQQFAKDILEFMRIKLSQFQQETGNLYNLEATPAEGATYRFAKEDQRRFPDILQAGTAGAPFYTNSSQLPVGYTDDVFEALSLQDGLQTKYTGGTVLHCYMNERVSNSEACRNLVRKVLENYRLPYITITPTFSICPKHGYLIGEWDFCPKCDRDIGYVEAPRYDEEFRKKYASAKSER